MYILLFKLYEKRTTNKKMGGIEKCQMQMGLSLYILASSYCWPYLQQLGVYRLCEFRPTVYFPYKD